MATINISDLRPAGSDLFSDSEGYMNELDDSEFDMINGGATPALLVSGAAHIAAKQTIKKSSKKCAAKAGRGAAIVGGVISGWIVGD